MILDEISLEDGALHALDLLDPESRECFESQVRGNPALDECVGEFRDIAAVVALARSGPLKMPPVSVLAGALARAGIDDEGLKRTVKRRLRAWWRPLAMAAAVAVLVAFSFWKGREMGKEESGHAGAAEREGGASIDAVDGGAGGGPHFSGQEGEAAEGGSRTLRELLDKLHRIERGGRSPSVIQDLARLRGELESMKRADAERFAAGPRLSRTVVVEMVEPGSEKAGATAVGDGLSERVGDYIAAGIGVETKPAGSSESGTGNETSGQAEPASLVLDEASGVPDLGSVAGDAAVYYRDFPAGNDAFERIDAGRVWDAANQRIWVETSEPGVYQAVLPPEGFDPDFPQDFEAVIPRAGTLPPPRIPVPVPDSPSPLPPVPASAVPRADTRAGRVAAPPVAFSIYDETTGRGSVIVGNLGVPGAGSAYQLWMRDAGNDRYVSVGLLPASTASVERFDFDLLGPGISPSEFMLTIENASGAAAPGSTIILHGP